MRKSPRWSIASTGYRGSPAKSPTSLPSKGSWALSRRSGPNGSVSYSASWPGLLLTLCSCPRIRWSSVPSPRFSMPSASERGCWSSSKASPVAASIPTSIGWAGSSHKPAAARRLARFPWTSRPAGSLRPDRRWRRSLECAMTSTLWSSATSCSRPAPSGWASSQQTRRRSTGSPAPTCVLPAFRTTSARRSRTSHTRRSSSTS